MTTRAVMKARIADELMRSDLTTQIGYAISDAIANYQSERFWFNESRSITFTTVASTEYYTALSGDVTNAKDILKVDYAVITVGSNVSPLDWIEPLEAEDLSNDGSFTGEPYAYSFYNQQIRLYPIPNDAWTVRLAGHIKIAEPDADGDTGNVWMVEAERLIRSRAKRNLALDGVLTDKDISNLSAFIQAQQVQEMDAFAQLKGRSGQMLGSGRIKPYC